MPRIVCLGRRSPAKPDEEGCGAQHAAIGAADRRRVDADEDFAGPRFGLRHMPDLDDVGWTVAGVDRGSHGHEVIV